MIFNGKHRVSSGPRTLFPSVSLYIIIKSISTINTHSFTSNKKVIVDLEQDESNNIGVSFNVGYLWYGHNSLEKILSSENFDCTLPSCIRIHQTTRYS